MALLTALFATVSATQIAVTASAGCVNIPVASAGLNAVFDQENQNETTATLHECMKKCRSSPMCKTFSFDRDKEACNIQLMNGPSNENTSPSPGTYSSTISQWNKGPCSTHACLANQRCHPIGARHVCKSAYDVCFRVMSDKVCFIQYEKFEMSVSGNDLGSNSTATVMGCVRYCTQNHPTFKSFIYENDQNLCTCISVTVKDYEQINGLLVVNAMMDIYSK